MTFIGPSLVRAGLFACLTALMGATTFRLLVLPRAEGGGAFDDALRSRARTVAASVGLTAAGTLLPVLGLVLLFQALAFRDPFEPMGQQTGLLLTATLWGRVWQAQTGLAFGAVIAYAGCRRRDTTLGWLFAALLTLGLAATPALSGHSMAAARWGGVVVAVDALHVVAAGAWLGGLAVSVVALSFRPANPEGRAAALEHLVVAFSPVALTSASLVGLTGLFNAWTHMGSLSAVWTSGYGVALATKLGLVAAVVALGAYNWRIVTPRLREPETAARFLSRSARMELAFGLIVILVTGVLVALPRPFDG